MLTKFSMPVIIAGRHMADSINGIYMYSGHKTQDFYIHSAPFSSGFQIQIYQYIKC